MFNFIKQQDHSLHGAPSKRSLCCMIKGVSMGTFQQGGNRVYIGF